MGAVGAAGVLDLLATLIVLLDFTTYNATGNGAAGAATGGGDRATVLATIGPGAGSRTTSLRRGLVTRRGTVLSRGDGL